MPVNALLVRWVGGWDEVYDGPSETTHGRREALLGLGAQQSLGEAQRLARAQLETFAQVRTEVAVDVAPVGAGDAPFVGYRVGDHVTAIDWEGTAEPTRVVALGGAVDDDGLVTYSVDLADQILTGPERHEQALKKLSNGTLRGTAKIATPWAALGKRQVPQTGGGDGGGG